MQKILSLLFFIVLLRPAHAQQADTTKYFEGYIDYTTEFKSRMPEVSDNELKVRFGANLRIYYSEKGLKWLFTDEAGYVLSYQIVDLASGIEYAWYDFQPDTIYTYNTTKALRNVVDSMAEGGTANIAGYDCQVLNIYCTVNYDNPAFSMPCLYQYYFCPSLKINPVTYTKLKDLRWNEVVNKYKCISIKMVSDFDNLSGTFTAYKIQHEKVTDSIYAIDKTKHFKKTFVD